MTWNTIVSIIYSFAVALIYYRFMRIFFKECRVSPQIERLCYILYAVIATVVHLGFRLPFLNLGSTLLCQYLLTLLYVGKNRHRIFLVVIFTFVFVIIEIAAAFFVTTTPINITQSIEISDVVNTVTSISTVIFTYLFVMVIGEIRRSRVDIHLPFKHWIPFVCIPILSFTMLIAIMQIQSVDTKIISFCALLALLITFFAYYFYEMVSSYIANKLEKKRIEQENIYYTRQLEMMYAFTESMRGMRHDMKNQIIALRGFLEKEQYDDLKEYMDGLSQSEVFRNHLVLSGNTTVDSILNYKSFDAMNKGVALELDVAVPERWQIAAADVAVVLGNLVDNAVEAATETEMPMAKVKLRYDMNCLFLHVENPYCGQRKEENGRFFTTKTDKESHGYGLKNVRRIVEERGGTIMIKTEDQRFVVDVVLPDKS